MKKTIDLIRNQITNLNYHFNYEFEYDSIKKIKEEINNHLYYDDYELKILNGKIQQLKQELLTRKKFEEEKEKKRLKKKQTEEYCTATFILVVTILILIKKLK